MTEILVILVVSTLVGLLVGVISGLQEHPNIFKNCPVCGVPVKSRKCPVCGTINI